MAKRLLHVELKKDQKERVLSVIERKSAESFFSTELKNYLKLATSIKPLRMKAIAARRVSSEKDYISRCAQRTLDQIPS